MSDQNHRPGKDDFWNQFPGSEKSKAKKVWEQAGLAGRTGKPVTKQEVEEALQDVHFRIESAENKKPGKFPGNRILNYSRYLVAATALIVAGLALFLVPKTITVPNTEVTVIELADGSTVHMNSGSTIQYSRLFSFTNRTLSLNGEAYFSVEPGVEPFVVKANGTIIEVTGTEFNVRSWQNDPGKKTTVSVTDGNVQFYPADHINENVMLMAGQTSRWEVDMIRPSEPETESMDANLAWRDNRLVFQDTPFIVIINELERKFGVTIELDAEGIQSSPLTAYYSEPTSVKPILEDICMVKGLRYTETANGFRIFKQE